MRGAQQRWGRVLTGALVAMGAVASYGAVAAPVQAQGEVRIVSGTVVDLTDGVATLSTNTGPMTVRTSPNTRYERQAPGTVGDLRPGMYVALTGRPADNSQTAVQIRVFPAAQATVPVVANRPMDGANAGNLMTNAVVQSVGDGQLTVSAAGEMVSASTTADTQVIRPEPAVAADFTEGRRIAATGIMQADGTLQAALVNVIE